MCANTKEGVQLHNFFVQQQCALKHHYFTCTPLYYNCNNEQFEPMDLFRFLKNWQLHTFFSVGKNWQLHTFFTVGTHLQWDTFILQLQ